MKNGNVVRQFTFLIHYRVTFFKFFSIKISYKNVFRESTEINSGEGKKKELKGCVLSFFPFFFCLSPDVCLPLVTA